MSATCRFCAQRICKCPGSARASQRMRCLPGKQAKQAGHKATGARQATSLGNRQVPLAMPPQRKRRQP